MLLWFILTSFFSWFISLFFLISLLINTAKKLQLFTLPHLKLKNVHDKKLNNDDDK